jgi:GT2 family glycosyltransferase
MRLLVIIVNFRTPDLTVDCLQSLSAEVPSIPGTQVTVVDNHSPDTSADQIERSIQDRGWSAWAHLLRADQNAGFSAGNNLAIREALTSADAPDYVLLLNPDTLVLHGALTELLGFLDAHPHAAIAGSRLESRDGCVQVSAFRFPTLISELESGARLGCLTRLLSRWIVSKPIPDAASPTDWVSGASLMIRRQALQESGLLDDRYFMYYEDTDLCLSAARAGWQTWYIPTSRVIHLVSQSSGGNSISEHWHDSRRRYFRKNHGRAYGLLADLAHLAGYASYCGRTLLRLTRRSADRSVAHSSPSPVEARIRSPLAASSGSIGIVVIGRNEGDRLLRCLDSLSYSGAPIVYVDSGSTDNSIIAARERGAIVLELDRSSPFTAARARNAGYRRLLQLRPESEFVQFIDGDCELAGDWLSSAVQFLKQTPKSAAVSGRLRERHPDASMYNRLCDIEWITPIGEVTVCGGLAMMRAQAFDEAGGFDPSLIAGEEPELCIRLRQKDWTIHSIDAEMASHDAAMTRFSQWWRRALRGGHAYAEAALLHGELPERSGVRESRSIWFWGAVLPVFAITLVWPSSGWSLALFILYPLLILRIYRSARRIQVSASTAALYAAACTVAKFPQLLGQIKFHRSRLSGRRNEIIEYRTVQVARHRMGSGPNSPLKKGV